MYAMHLFSSWCLTRWIECAYTDVPPLPLPHPLHPLQQVHHIHHIMAALLFFKTLSVLFEAVRFHSYQVRGMGWTRTHTGLPCNTGPTHMPRTSQPSVALAARRNTYQRLAEYGAMLMMHGVLIGGWAAGERRVGGVVDRVLHLLLRQGRDALRGDPAHRHGMEPAQALPQRPREAHRALRPRPAGTHKHTHTHISTLLNQPHSIPIPSSPTWYAPASRAIQTPVLLCAQLWH
jgi:hypothetical protein